MRPYRVCFRCTHDKLCMVWNPVKRWLTQKPTPLKAGVEDYDTIAETLAKCCEEFKRKSKDTPNG